MTAGFYRRRGTTADHPYLSAGVRVDRVVFGGAGVFHIVGRALHRVATGWATGSAIDRTVYSDAFEPMEPPR